MKIGSTCSCSYRAPSMKWQNQNPIAPLDLRPNIQEAQGTEEQVKRHEDASVRSGLWEIQRTKEQGF